MTDSAETAEQLKEAIRQAALETGFEAVGFAPADHPAFEQHAEELRRFLADGREGDMHWLGEEERLDRRSHPQQLWPGVRSVIMLLQNYGPDADPIVRDPSKGAVSCYARGRDYHDVVKKRLKKLARWLVDRSGAEVKVFVDTAPVMEKPLAVLAGLGWQGKHTNLVSRQLGSWSFIGSIFTSLELPPDAPHHDRCGACRACLDACPTQAFDGPGRIDPRRCISYLTIEHQGPIPEALRPMMGNRIYGCDDCLAVCPWNKFARTAAEIQLQAKEHLKAPALAELLQLDDAGFRAFFAQSAAKRLGRNRFIRNVLIAAGNSGNKALLAAIEPHLEDDNETIRDAAHWARTQLTAG